MATILNIDPVTRLEGHLSIKVKIETMNGIQQVVNAWASGTLFRGFEKLLIGRDPWDAINITQRICGVCPTPHGMASAISLDKANNVTPPVNARILRNLILGANFLQSHILHFYHLCLPDFIDGPDMPPWKPNWQTDKRISPTKSNELFNNYVRAMNINRKIQEMGAIFGGRLPFTPVFIPGGITKKPVRSEINTFKTYLNEVLSFISNVYINDVEYIASVYKDYYSIGRGYGNLLSFGVFTQESGTKLLKRGRIVRGSQIVNPVNTTAITEGVTYSWYSESTYELNPVSGETAPMYPKNNAYSWLKAPRYLGDPYEVGPLARMWVNGNYRRGISVIDRHLARAYETRKIANAMMRWLDEIVIGGPVYTQHVPVQAAVATGLTEAPRGALGHWVQINNGKLSHYQIITPTCWNASPRDKDGILGPIEEALIGTPVKNINEPIEVLRVIHSFDPCLSCAVHIIKLKRGK